MFFIKKLTFKTTIFILIFAILFSGLPTKTIAAQRPLDAVFTAADYKIFDKAYHFSPDKNFLNILEQFYGETKEAIVRMDTEKYNSAEISTFADSLKFTLNKALENAEKYQGDSEYIDDIIKLLEDYIALLDSIVLKAKGLDSENPTTLGFHNFDFSKNNVEFTDVPKGIWYEEDVKRLASAGIFKGTGNNKFEPDKVLTKAEAMALTARINAIYNGRLYDFEKIMEKGGANWEQAVFDYCDKYEAPLVMPREFHEVCDRNYVSRLIIGSLPKETFVFKNSSFDIPHHSDRIHFTAQDTILLFVYGICMGNGTSLDGRGELTRAQAAALIYRTANPEARITLRDYLYIPDNLITKYPESYSYMKADNSEKAYKRVYQLVGTKWDEGMRDLTGNVDTRPTHEYVKYFKYGGYHNYFTANQEQYEFVTDTAIEAFNYANDPLNIKPEHYDNLRTHYNKEGKKVPVTASYVKGEISYEEMVKIYFEPTSRVIKTEEARKRIDEAKEFYGMTSDEDYFNVVRLRETVGLMGAYLADIAEKNTVPNAKEYSRKVGDYEYALNESYYYLTKGMPLDCDGLATIDMLIYDTLGFSTRMMSSVYGNHAIPEMYVGDRWMCVSSDRTGFQYTHEDLLYDIATMNPKTRDGFNSTNNLYVRDCATDLRVSIGTTHDDKFHD